MEIVKKIFDKALVLKLRTRMDNRGLMTVNYEDEFVEGKIGFKTKESRVYTIPKKGSLRTEAKARKDQAACPRSASPELRAFLLLQSVFRPSSRKTAPPPSEQPVILYSNPFTSFREFR